MSAAPFKVFIDGGCPMCRREATLLERLDRGRGRLLLVDLTAPGFAASEHGIDPVAAMRTIHGRRADGTIVTGVAVFREAWAAVGLGWLWAPTAWPIIRPLTDFAYRRFARWRLHRRARAPHGSCRLEMSSISATR